MNKITNDKLKIFYVGTKGIPNKYGGWEVVAEKTSVYFREKGHFPHVFCSKDNLETSK